MLITFSMNLPRIEKKRLEIKMRLTDLETLLHSKKENAKITMQESRALITIYSKLMREQMNYQNSLTQENLNLEEQMIILMLLWPI